jgi:hypothetical protein
MARTRTKPAEQTPAPEPEETEGDGTVRGPGEMHDLFSAFLKETTGEDVDPLHIFLVTSKRTAFRKTEAYEEFAAAQEERRDEAFKAKEARAKNRAATATEDDAEATAPKARGRRAKATTEEAPADAPEPTAPRRGRRTAAKPAAAPTEAETGDAEVTPIRSRRRRSAPAAATTETGKKTPF